MPPLTSHDTCVAPDVEDTAPRRGPRRRLPASCGWLALLGALAWPAAAGDLQVKVEGLSGDLQSNVEAFLSIVRERETPDLLESRIRRLHDRAPEEIREALAPFGHYRPRVDADLSRTESGGWLARYTVEAGEPIPVGQVEVQVTGEGRDEPGWPEAGIRAGGPFLHAAYEDAKKRLVAFARARGYLEARFEQSEVLVDLETYRADVSLHLATGPRFYFGPLTFEQDGFDPDFLDRFVTFEPGEPFRYASLVGLQSALYSTEYFSAVEVRPRIDDAEERRIPVDVALTLNPPNRHRIGFGYATDTGPRVSYDWTRRYIGRRGHSASALVSLSPVIQRLEAGYRVPLEEPRREYLSYQARAENYDTSSRTGALLSLRASHNSFEGNWQRILALDYDFESPRTEGDDETFTLVPNASWIWKVQDDPIYTSRGFRLDLTVLGAAEPVLSNSTFLQGRVRGKGIYSPTGKTRVIGRAELGGTMASDVREVPLSRRFYAGGDNSVRGYDYEDLSPRDAEGEKTGARYLVTGSLEVERRIAEKWGVAAFYDTGNAFDDFDDFDLVAGAGVGVRWLSPVGLVRLDLAQGFEDDTFRVHLVIGPDL